MGVIENLIEKAKTVSHDGDDTIRLAPESHWTTSPTRRQIYTYRRHRGVNLGSWFTLETWLTPSLFQGVHNAKSEYDLCKQLGEVAARERLERHWRTFIDDGDWNWMRSQGITTIRLPISYFHFLSGHPDMQVRILMISTEYETYTKIYQSALHYIVKAVEKAQQYSIGVLIDLHAAPGAQNPEGHSGLSTGKANFYNKDNMDKTTNTLVAMANTFGKYDNVIGIELINEPQDNDKLADWYKKAVSKLRRETVHQHLPLVLGDCWNMQRYANVISSFNDNAGPLLLDHHLYRCFTPQDCQTSAADHAANIHPQSRGSWHQMLCDASPQINGGIIIGEWSAALNPGSFDNCRGQEKEHQRAWARAQLDSFNAHCAGHFFWTLKKEGSPDPGWCLYSAIEQDILPTGLGRPRSGVDLIKLQRLGSEMCQSNYNDHVRYWAQNGGGSKMHHERYRDGFNQVYKDCLNFYQHCGEEIGLAGQWIAQRAKSYSYDKGSNDGEWEFIHGGTKAYECFLDALRTS